MQPNVGFAVLKSMKQSKIDEVIANENTGTPVSSASAASRMTVCQCHLANNPPSDCLPDRPQSLLLKCAQQTIELMVLSSLQSRQAKIVRITITSVMTGRMATSSNSSPDARSNLWTLVRCHLPSYHLRLCHRVSQWRGILKFEKLLSHCSNLKSSKVSWHSTTQPQSNSRSKLQLGLLLCTPV